MRYLLGLSLIFASSIAQATDWLTLPSSFSHDANGVRVSQYAPIEPPTSATAPNFRTSGYTHTRSSLNYGQSADNYHRVEEWGDPVRPYGEWRFPYRPFGTPYPNWGPPYAGLNIGFPYPAPFFGGGGGGHHGGRPGIGGPGGPGVGGPGVGGPGGGQYPGVGWHGGRGWHDRGFLGGGRWPTDRYRFEGSRTPASPFNPYPAGPGSPYPVAPYYDGYYPNYRQ